MLKKQNRRSNMKDFIDGAKSYLILSAILSVSLLFVAAITLFLGLNDPTAPIQTIGDAFNVFVIGYYYNGTLIGGIAWKWHLVFMIIFGITNFFDNNS
jgi:hypothetical protein